MSYPLNTENNVDGVTFLNTLPGESTKLVFFDPQYRQILDRQNYGNEGARQKERALLPAMSTEVINDFISEITRVLKPSGHMCLWVDKYMLVTGIGSILNIPDILHPVDMITWDKQRIGMGYRSRRKSEYLVILQKLPLRAKGVWTSHDIPDVWSESVPRKGNHAHAKPEGLQSALINAMTEKGDIVVDPAAGGFSVMRSALAIDRQFWGTSI